MYVNSHEMHVAYIAEDGTVENMPCTFSNGKLVFETDHFSCFAFIPGEEKDQTLNHMAVIIMSVLMIIAICGALAYKRRA